MTMFSDPHKSYETWDYIVGDHNNSLGVKRLHFLESLNYLNKGGLMLSFHDLQTKAWTKWTPYDKIDVNQVMTAVDVHRSMLHNEIIVESDFEDYKDNLQASKVVGNVLESKGFVPHYYFSGNKSIHIHVYFNFKSLLELDLHIQNKILETFKSKKRFVTKFMSYLREKMITCWGMKNSDFDKNFLKDKHLVRAELSRNKKGFKTFLGYSHKDLRMIPDIFHEQNGILPRLGEVKLSTPNNVHLLVEEFFDTIELKDKKKKLLMKESSLMKWVNPELTKQVKPCVQKLLEQSDVDDGHHRALFIICNELKRTMSDEQVLARVMAWNQQLNEPIKESDVQYRVFREKCYSIRCNQIREVLEARGISDMCKNCKMKHIR